MEIRQAIFACPGKINILGFVVLVVSTSPERVPRGPFANNNDQVTGLQGPTHEKTKQGSQYCLAALCVRAVQAVLWHCTNTAVGYKSKVPHKEPVPGEPVDQGNGVCFKKKPGVCGVPKEKPRGAVIACCKSLRG